jgi:hypothetical protein
MKPEILGIIKYLSERFFGTPEDPEDVKIKYLIEDEPAPYWWVKVGHCKDFRDLEELNKLAEAEGYVLSICIDGFWFTSKESYEKRKAKGYA